jgi:hypothetical protein
MAAALLPAAVAGADSFNPITLTVSVGHVARLHRPLRIRVAVTADAGVLDTATAPLRVQVKLAAECGGVFDGTPGPVLLDKRLNPQPATGRPYAASVSGSGKPQAYGLQTVCVFLTEEVDGRQFAADQSAQVDVSRSCTVAAARYDRARARHTRRARRAAAQARWRARRACGRGVPL